MIVFWGEYWIVYDFWLSSSQNLKQLMEKLEIEEGRVGRWVQKLQKYNETNLSKSLLRRLLSNTIEPTVLWFCLEWVNSFEDAALLFCPSPN